MESTWTSPPVRRSPCSAPTAPARPPCSRSWPRCCGPRAAPPRWPATTARANLKFWATLSGLPADADTLSQALADVDLERHAEARVRTFSAGMKRRLALARVGLARPRVLLLDEPFAALDARARKWLEARLEGFKAGGGALVMATHSFGRELGVADRLAILAGGRIALDTPRGALGPDDVQRLYVAHTEEGS